MLKVIITHLYIYFPEKDIITNTVTKNFDNLTFKHETLN